MCAASRFTQAVLRMKEKPRPPRTRRFDAFTHLVPAASCAFDLWYSWPLSGFELRSASSHPVPLYHRSRAVLCRYFRKLLKKTWQTLELEFFYLYWNVTTFQGQDWPQSSGLLYPKQLSLHHNVLRQFRTLHIVPKLFYIFHSLHYNSIFHCQPTKAHNCHRFTIL